ncbi:unnamed protein product [Vicia faba]|uniref:Uncharacterized protein n=1 Tax=Vicia faba TaxID=3906 RepID=A0AAV0Z1Y2_VICFA|nr:unnamed protein product [Vicia faba]
MADPISKSLTASMLIASLLLSSHASSGVPFILDASGVLSHTFELEAKSKGVFSGEPAVIKFRVPTNAVLQVALLTPILPLDILADRPPEKKFEWAKRLLAKYGSLISVISIIVMFVYLVATPSKYGKDRRKRRRIAASLTEEMTKARHEEK